MTRPRDYPPREPDRELVRLALLGAGHDGGAGDLRIAMRAVRRALSTGVVDVHQQLAVAVAAVDAKRGRG
jgi:hypothetical protein